MPKFSAPVLRQKLLAMLESHPEGLRSKEMQLAIIGEADDEQTFRRDQVQVSNQLKALTVAKRVRKFGSMQQGVWKLLGAHQRPEPQVDDLPAAPKRKYTKRGTAASNGTSNGGGQGELLAYLVRDIKAKLDELLRVVG